MDSQLVAVTSQCGIFGTFAIYLFFCLRSGNRNGVALIGGVLFAIIFEHLNVVRFAHVRGGYSYHPASWFQIAGDTPLYVPLAWGYILATSRTLTDRLRLKFWARPFCDALLTLLIDTSLDVVAIRLHFWSWRGIGRREGFFGVPADNFLGWLLVSLSFSILVRGLDSPYFARSVMKIARQSPRARTALSMAFHWLLLPPIAFALYLGLEKSVGLCYRMFQANTLQRQLLILLAYIVVFLSVVALGAMREREYGRSDTSPEMLQETSEFAQATNLSRLSFHLFGVFGLLYLTLVGARPEWELWLATGAAWGLERGVGELSKQRVKV